MSASNSDSDSDDDPNLALLREAADTDFMTDDLFKATGVIGKPQTNSITSNDSTATARGSLKSQRNASPVDEHRNADDLSVPESMQKFIATKMSEIIARQIEFVDVPKRTATADQTGILSAVRLLRGSNHLVGLIDEWSLLADETVARPKQRKPTIKRRQIEPLNMNANDRINACAVTMDDVCRETADWHRKESTVKRNRRHFEYKSIDGQCYLIEPETEFTKLRKKNNWSENKIKRIDT